MKKTRTRVLIGILIASMAVTGVVVGTVAADDNAATGRDGVLARVAEILGIDQGELEEAFQQAVQEEREARRQRMEEAREARIQGLIEEGVLTQEQVDEWEEWMESRPDNRDEIREWLESRPDLDIDGSFGMRAFGDRMAPGRSGRMMHGSFGGECPACTWPATPDVES